MIFIPVNVHVIGVVPGTNDPVLGSEISVRTLAVMDPVHKTPPAMNASGIPDNGMFAPALENVMRTLPPAGTVAMELKVMTKGWQALGSDWQVGSETAVTWYPEMGPVAAVAAVVSMVVVTLRPVSLPPVAAPREMPLKVKVMTVAAATAFDPVSTNFWSENELKVYPEGAPVTANMGWAEQEGETTVGTKKLDGHAIVMKFSVAAHPPDVASVTAVMAVVVVNVMTGVTAVPADRLANGIVIDTAVTAVLGAGPTVRVEVQALV